MAGAGFDAAMIRDRRRRPEGATRRVAYVWPASKISASKPSDAKIEVDGADWYEGKASCILLGNLGKLFGGVEAFADARPDDGELELGVVTAEGMLEWARMLARVATGTTPKSPFVADDEGAVGEGRARPQGAVRARRRRSNEAGRRSR